MYLNIKNWIICIVISLICLVYIFNYIHIYLIMFTYLYSIFINNNDMLEAEYS